MELKLMSIWVDRDSPGIRIAVDAQRVPMKLVNTLKLTPCSISPEFCASLLILYEIANGTMEFNLC